MRNHNWNVIPAEYSSFVACMWMVVLDAASPTIVSSCCAAPIVSSAVCVCVNPGYAKMLESELPKTEIEK